MNHCLGAIVINIELTRLGVNINGAEISFRFADLAFTCQRVCAVIIIVAARFTSVLVIYC
jgi:hypothetical protein